MSSRADFASKVTLKPHLFNRNFINIQRIISACILFNQAIIYTFQLRYTRFNKIYYMRSVAL